MIVQALIVANQFSSIFDYESILIYLIQYISCNKIKTEAMVGLREWRDSPWKVSFETPHSVKFSFIEKKTNVDEIDINNINRLKLK